MIHKQVWGFKEFGIVIFKRKQLAFSFKLFGISPVNRFIPAFLVPKHHVDFVVISGTNVARKLHLISDYTINGNNRYCNKGRSGYINKSNFLFFSNISDTRNILNRLSLIPNHCKLEIQNPIINPWAIQLKCQYIGRNIICQDFPSFSRENCSLIHKNDQRML